ICLHEEDKIDEAEQQFKFKDYRQALNLFKRALKYTTENSTNTRVDLANAFAKLNKLEKTELAFNRPIEIDSKYVGALVGLAILELNMKILESIRNGVMKLSRVYQYDSQNPMVLNYSHDIV
ncbi:unnamed protein product, partial [Rotaria sp. Silwood2]